MIARNSVARRRHAAALAAELERHSDKRPPRKMKDEGRTPSSDAVGGEPHTPSAEERVQVSIYRSSSTSRALQAISQSSRFPSSLSF